MKTEVEQRPVDRQFEAYDQTVQHQSGRAIRYPLILLFAFGLLTVIWAIPFPNLAFLGRYNGYVNWASFLIAGLIYYYLRLSPLLSYVTLFMLFAFSYLIIQLEQWQKTGGPDLWLIGAICLTIGLIGQYFLLRAGRQFYVAAYALVWLLITLFKKLNLKY